MYNVRHCTLRTMTGTNFPVFSTVNQNLWNGLFIDCECLHSPLKVQIYFPLSCDTLVAEAVLTCSSYKLSNFCSHLSRYFQALMD